MWRHGEENFQHIVYGFCMDSRVIATKSPGYKKSFPRHFLNCLEVVEFVKCGPKTVQQKPFPSMLCHEVLRLCGTCDSSEGGECGPTGHATTSQHHHRLLEGMVSNLEI